jgi:hypothetical protein
LRNEAFKHGHIALVLMGVVVLQVAAALILRFGDCAGVSKDQVALRAMIIAPVRGIDGKKRPAAAQFAFGVGAVHIGSGCIVFNEKGGIAFSRFDFISADMVKSKKFKNSPDT